MVSFMLIFHELETLIISSSRRKTKNIAYETEQTKRNFYNN